jgi:hypothetical protein
VSECNALENDTPLSLDWVPGIVYNASQSLITKLSFLPVEYEIVWELAFVEGFFRVTISVTIL